jgi:hypothetical protein
MSRKSAPLHHRCEIERRFNLYLYPYLHGRPGHLGQRPIPSGSTDVQGVVQGVSGLDEHRLRPLRGIRLPSRASARSTPCVALFFGLHNVHYRTLQDRKCLTRRRLA